MRVSIGPSTNPSCLCAGLVSVFFLAPAGGDLHHGGTALPITSAGRVCPLGPLRILQRPRNELLAPAEETDAHGAIKIAREAKGAGNRLDLLAGTNACFARNAVVTDPLRGTGFEEGEDRFRGIHPANHIGRPVSNTASTARKQTNALPKNFLDNLLQGSISSTKDKTWTISG